MVSELVLPIFGCVFDSYYPSNNKDRLLKSHIREDLQNTNVIRESEI